MAPQLELEYRLRWMDFDKYDRLQPFALFDIFQDVATMQAEEMGIGRDAMLAEGVFWVIIRQKYEVVREPGHYQAVRVKTWPHTPSRFSFLRDFFVCDEEGELLIKATSEWVLLDAATRKFASVADHYDASASEFVADRAFERKPRRVLSFDEGNRPVVELLPRYSDIDLNGHVNNASYLHYVIDALNPGAEGSIKSLQLDYRYEVLPDEPIAMHTLVEGESVRLKGVRSDGQVAFLCGIELV